MGFTSDGDLADLFDQAPMRRAVDRMARGVASLMHEEVQRRTPVASPPPGWSAAEYAAHRGRVPGSLRESWRTTEPAPVRQVGGTEGVAVEVVTDDYVGIFVENGTKPRRIEPKRRGKMLAMPAAGGGMRFAPVVDHPGTQGAHMVRDGMADVAATWPERVGRDEVDRWAREQLEGTRGLRR